jgi:hypothetical protein
VGLTEQALTEVHIIREGKHGEVTYKLVTIMPCDNAILFFKKYGRY